MNVTTETATVYRGGGRRWFSKAAAINAEAGKVLRNWIRDTKRCECSPYTGEWDAFSGDPGPEYCRYCERDGDYSKRLYKKTVALVARKSAYQEGKK